MVANAIIWFMDQVGYAICHQLNDRSLTYGGRVLPVCARDAGIFLGFSICFIALLLAYGRDWRRYPSRAKIAVLALFLLPAVVDAVTAYAGLRESTNALRLISGVIAGTGLAALVFPLSTGAARSTEEPEDAGALKPAFESWWSIILLLPLTVIIPLALWPDWPGAYWVWGPLVTLSILFTLFVLNYILISLVSRRLRSGSHLPGASALAALATAAAFIELIVSNRLHWLVDRFL